MSSPMSPVAWYSEAALATAEARFFELWVIAIQDSFGATFGRRVAQKLFNRNYHSVAKISCSRESPDDGRRNAPRLMTVRPPSDKRLSRFRPFVRMIADRVARKIQIKAMCAGPGVWSRLPAGPGIRMRASARPCSAEGQVCPSGERRLRSLPSRHTHTYPSA